MQCGELIFRQIDLQDISLSSEKVDLTEFLKGILGALCGTLHCGNYRNLLSLKKKIRQINYLVKTLLSRNFCQKRVRE